MSYKKNTLVEVLPDVDLFQKTAKKKKSVGDATHVSAGKNYSHVQQDVVHVSYRIRK